MLLDLVLYKWMKLLCVKCADDNGTLSLIFSTYSIRPGIIELGINIDTGLKYDTRRHSLHEKFDNFFKMWFLYTLKINFYEIVCFHFAVMIESKVTELKLAPNKNRSTTCIYTIKQYQNCNKSLLSFIIEKHIVIKREKWG